MIGRARILSLIPHQGAMCLLDRAESWSERELLAASGSHLAPDNPLRSNGMLQMLCGAEYGFQAACLHGALAAGGVRQKPGYVASLEISRIAAGRLDDPAHGLLQIRAMLEFDDPAGCIYRFTLHSEGGCMLLEGRGGIITPPGR